jgi:hypothetical protein
MWDNSWYDVFMDVQSHKILAQGQKQQQKKSQTEKSDIRNHRIKKTTTIISPQFHPTIPTYLESSALITKLLIEWDMSAMSAVIRSLNCLNFSTRSNTSRK